MYPVADRSFRMSIARSFSVPVRTGNSYSEPLSTILTVVSIHNKDTLRSQVGAMWQISPAGDFDHGRFAASWDDEVVFRIIRKEVFSPTTFLWEVLAPDVAGASCPGQFVMVRLKECGERIPLTVADFDRRCGS